MVVSAQRLASEAGVAILQQGGNAVDAAVAVGYAEAVVNPCCGNIGGGGFMVAHLADGRNVFLNFRETAPAAATRDMYLDAAGNVVPGRQPAWLARRRGARHGAGPRHRADAIRHAAAIRGDGAGDPAGARGLRADPLRHRHHAARHGIVPPRAKRRADLPARRRIAAATGRPAGAAGPRRHAASDRRQRPGCLLSRPHSARGGSGIARRRRHHHRRRLRRLSHHPVRAAVLHVSRLSSSSPRRRHPRAA